MALANAGLVVLPINDAAGHAPPARLAITQIYGTTLVSDNFNRADSSTTVGAPQIGSAPSAISGTWGISSNALYQAAIAGATYNVLSWATGAPDVQVDVDLTTVSGYIGVAVRITDTNNYYMAHSNGLYRYSAGVPVGPVFAYTGAFASGDHLTVKVQGNTFTVLKNGTSLGSGTDSALAVTSNHGVFAASDNVGGRWDNLTIAALPTSATLYTDRTKATAIGATMQKVDGLCPTINNTVYCDIDGVARFYAVPGLYSAVKTVNGVQSAAFTIPVPPDPIELASKF